MLLVGSICTLGFDTLLIGELPRQSGKEGTLISTALIAAGAAGLTAGSLFACSAPLLSADLSALGATRGNILVFALGVALTSVSLVLDEALIGLLRGGVQLWRNTLFASSKLLALFLVTLWLPIAAAMTIVMTWIFGSALSLTIIIASMALKRGTQYVSSYLPRWKPLWNLGGTALRHHVLNLLLHLPVFALPVLVTIILSARVNAWFFVSWTIANFVSILPASLTTVLFAVSSANSGSLVHRTRTTLVLSIIACALGVVFLLLWCKPIFSLFGQIYAEEAATSLRILSLGSFPLIIKYHYIALCRIRNRMESAILPLAISAGLELGLAWLGAHLGGLSGLCIGWVIAVSLETLLMFNPVYEGVQASPEPRRRHRSYSSGNWNGARNM